MRIAGAQICVNDTSVEANVEAITRGIAYAAEEKADILLTPEGSLSGYHNRFDRTEVREALADVVALAKEAGIGLALGTCFEEEDGHCYNQLRFYDKSGRFLGFHSKTLTCGTLTEPPVGEINDFTVKPLEVFRFNGETIGGLICNDMWANPQCSPLPDTHLSQQLSTMGAKVIFHAVNGGRDESDFSQRVVRQFHESNLQMRAKAGGVWIVTVDNAFPVEQGNACSGGVIGPDGQWMVKAPDRGEQYFTYTITS
ncbi:carbon-nitrogen hydrolase family protein [Paenibacillus sp. BC26]|uniref:carbon-nitrogen hydrolase family protein n=1 Tax=Paenibacillus sp. BC26 TaxID=1881032 RepID=UPI0008E21ECE|nr:carbon-nitrogen hydrolase family protein [Paenibacillus sp. BC26]SFS73858.1 Predicted amidohydrolase [Paenibacillus sp. BC26]